MRSQLQQPIDEQAGFTDPKRQKQLVKNCQASPEAIDADLDQVNRHITQLIEQDDQLKERFALMTSIPGVGIATATEVILATDEFKAITDPKKIVLFQNID